jgi:capsular polysaccharide biosynthesis protein
MDLREFWRTLRHRWYLTLLVVLAAAAAAAFVSIRVGPTYQATGSTLIFPPSVVQGTDNVTQTVGNPYLELSGMNQARDIVVRALTAKDVRDEFDEKYPKLSFEVTPDPSNSAPVVLFSVEATTRDGATGSLEELMERVPAILRRLQQNVDVPAGGKITSMTLTSDSEPELVRKSQIRSAVVAAVAVAGPGLLLLAVLDNLLAARRSRKAVEPRVRRAKGARRPARQRGHALDEIAKSPEPSEQT